MLLPLIKTRRSAYLRNIIWKITILTQTKTKTLTHSGVHTMCILYLKTLNSILWWEINNR